MISAQEARDIFEKRCELDELFTLIEKAAINGDGVIMYSKKINKIEEAKLLELGYVIKSSNQFVTVVQWIEHPIDEPIIVNSNMAVEGSH